jgi:hypothetical protein
MLLQLDHLEDFSGPGHPDNMCWLTAAHASWRLLNVSHLRHVRARPMRSPPSARSCRRVSLFSARLDVRVLHAPALCVRLQAGVGW